MGIVLFTEDGFKVCRERWPEVSFCLLNDNDGHGDFEKPADIVEGESGFRFMVP